MVSSRLLETLSAWVVHESDKVGGMAMLSSLLSGACGDRISDAAIAKWRDKKISNGGLRGKSLNAIAAYRQMTPSEVLAWLETGNDPKSEVSVTSEVEPTPDRLRRLEQTLMGVISEIARIRESLTDREILTTPKGKGTIGVNLSVEYFGNNMRFGTLRDLCAYEFRNIGLSYEDGIEELLLSFPAETPEDKAYMRRLIEGDAVMSNEWADNVAVALEALTNKEYTADLVIHLQTPDCPNHAFH